MAIPVKEIQYLIFTNPVDFYGLKDFCGGNIDSFFKNYNFEEINWLNTPGPIYTSCTDNCGTGVIESPKNVAEDDNGREFIFKQPINHNELICVTNAAFSDPFCSYFYNGNNFWNHERILNWWSRHEERVKHIYKQYRSDSIKIKENNFQYFRSVESYKSLFKFYQFELKEYLEWYIFNQSRIKITLPEKQFDWQNMLELK